MTQRCEVRRGTPSDGHCSGSECREPPTVHIRMGGWTFRLCARCWSELRGEVDNLLVQCPGCGANQTDERGACRWCSTIYRRAKRVGPAIPLQSEWCAWGVEHDSHGPTIDEICWMPPGDKPETNLAWIRMPWLDSPAVKCGPTPGDEDGKAAIRARTRSSNFRLDITNLPMSTLLHWFHDRDAFREALVFDPEGASTSTRAAWDELGAEIDRRFPIPGAKGFSSRG